MKNWLDGIRVLDLTSVLMGPMSTQILADQGADVVCVEGERISTQRQLGPGPDPQFSGMALNLLRNKRSVVLNLRRSHGRQAFLDIVRTCDAVVTNLRPKSLASLELTYERVAEVQPKLVWCEAHGYSSATGESDAPMYDDIVQAESGISDLMVRSGLTAVPTYLPTVIADKVCAYAIAQAVLAGVLQVQRTGSGTSMEVSMVDVMRSFVLAEHGAGAVSLPAVSEPGYERVLSAHRRPYATSDGFIAVMPYGPDDWRAVLGALERPDLATDSRLASHRSALDNAPELYAALGKVIAGFTTTECLRRVRSAGVACAPLAALDDLLERCPIALHPDVGAYREFPTGITSSNDADRVTRPAPRQGQHTAELLQEVGSREDVVQACLADLQTMGDQW